MRFRSVLLAFLLAVTINSCSYQTPQESSIPLTTNSTKTLNAIPTKPTLTFTPVLTATCTSTPNYTDVFQNNISINTNSCNPDNSWQSISFYVYDLSTDQELVSIDADTPYLFASAFKGPVLVYFLDSCKQYWNVTSPSWDDYFQDGTATNNNEWFSSKEYKDLLVDNLSDVKNWEDIVAFSIINRENNYGYSGDLDQRYYILAHVYKMVTQSNNVSTGHVLNFVYDNCLNERTPTPRELECGNTNAISAFNNWFNGFSDIEYNINEKQRGLYAWDVITTIDEDHTINDQRMPTYGLIDKCADQNAFIRCSQETWAKNTWTARDLFKFYQALYRLEDDSVKSTAMSTLSIDEPGIVRGYLKNLARKMNTTVMSKNGSSGYITSDAGILNYQGKYYAISVLSYNAFDSLNILFGQFDAFGNPDGFEKGLLQRLIEGSITSK